MSDPTLVVRPADQASWDDLSAIFGHRGTCSRCWCQRYKQAPGEAFGTFPAEERAQRLRIQTACDQQGAAATSGLVGYLGTDPVGWCAVEPRANYAGLVRTFRVPWEGRQEDRNDSTVWAVTCLLTRAGSRKGGVSRVMARAAVDFARSHGARAVEAYPVTTTRVIEEELHVGTIATFAAAGLREISRPTPRRVVMRVDF